MRDLQDDNAVGPRSSLDIFTSSQTLLHLLQDISEFGIPPLQPTSIGFNAHWLGLSGPRSLQPRAEILIQHRYQSGSTIIDESSTGRLGGFFEVPCG